MKSVVMKIMMSYDGDNDCVIDYDDNDNGDDDNLLS